MVRAEQKAELAEFDEDIPWDEKEELRREQQVSKVEMELALIDKEASSSGTRREARSTDLMACYRCIC